MIESTDHLPDDTDALKAALIETRAKLSGAEALIAHLQLTIEKMKRAMFGPRSERSQRLIDQLELQLEELAAAAGEERRRPRRRASMCRASRGAQGRGATSRPICRAGGLFTLRRRRVLAAAGTSSPRSARTSPRRSTSSPGNGS